MPETPTKTARLALSDGTIFRGDAFGAVDPPAPPSAPPRVQVAEVVFNTSMTGYQEALTDPSYAGQILTMTAPLVGNTGINEEDVESAKVQVAGFLVRELARVHSNFRATKDLSAYLKEQGVLGITGIDTRALTRKLRVGGAMMGALTTEPAERLSDADLVQAARSAPEMTGQNLVPLVGCATRGEWDEDLGEWKPNPGGSALRAESSGRDAVAEENHGSESRATLHVLALDCGAKRNILRNLTDRGCTVTILPHTATAEEILAAFGEGGADGLFISNGPGDPAAVEKTIAELKKILQSDNPPPTFGICLGHQLLSLAAGAKTFKLKFGHRGANQPILNLLNGRVEITSQNHGFAVDRASLEAIGGVPTHIHLNDQTLAGFCLADKPVFSVQYHPEASPGPHDSGYLFDAFVEMMRTKRPPAAVLRGPGRSDPQMAQIHAE
jgi:carbamoyl-phosphate synthase small subunit